MKCKTAIKSVVLILIAVLPRADCAAGGFVQRFPLGAVALYADVASVTQAGPNQYHFETPGEGRDCRPI